MLRTIYLSHFLDSKTPGYGGNKEFTKKSVKSICCGDSSNKTEIFLTTHIGTHVDLPYHFLETGMQLHDYPPEFWIIDKSFLLHIPVSSGEIIELHNWIDEIPTDTEFLIIKTGFENFRFEETYHKNNPGISPSSAQVLKHRCRCIRFLGFDFISLTSFSNRELGRIAHKEFLGSHNGSPILIIEDMHLKELSKTPVKIYIAPLLIHAGDGSPVTVFAEIQ